MQHGDHDEDEEVYSGQESEDRSSSEMPLLSSISAARGQGDHDDDSIARPGLHRFEELSLSSPITPHESFASPYGAGDSLNVLAAPLTVQMGTREPSEILSPSSSSKENKIVRRTRRSRYRDSSAALAKVSTSMIHILNPPPSRPCYSNRIPFVAYRPNTGGSSSTNFTPKRPPPRRTPGLQKRPITVGGTLGASTLGAGGSTRYGVMCMETGDGGGVICHVFKRTLS